MDNKQLEEQVPGYLIEGTAWNQLWRSIGFFIRQMGRMDSYNLTSVILTIIVPPLIAIFAISAIILLYQVNSPSPEQIRAYTEAQVAYKNNLQELIAFGVPPEVAKCILKPSELSYACADILENTNSRPGS